MLRECVYANFIINDYTLAERELPHNLTSRHDCSKYVKKISFLIAQGKRNFNKL